MANVTVPSNFPGGALDTRGVFPAFCTSDLTIPREQMPADALAVIPVTNNTWSSVTSCCSGEIDVYYEAQSCTAICVNVDGLNAVEACLNKKGVFTKITCADGTEQCSAAYIDSQGATTTATATASAAATSTHTGGATKATLGVVVMVIGVILSQVAV